MKFFYSPQTRSARLFWALEEVDADYELVRIDIRDENRSDPEEFRAASPLGKVLKGHGNNGVDGFEGVLERRVFGTYLHGPLLPKNAWLADHLIATAMSRRGLDGALEPLEDELERAAHDSARSAAGISRR